MNGQFDSNGRRNESDIFVRGFGRWQVPLLVDGVRIYLPADNRLDFSRFLTGDVAEIQIQKGYASVLAGPGAMGGLINLVSIKPTQAFEGEATEGFVLTDSEAVSGSQGYARIGSRHDSYYVQGSVSYVDRNSWNLPGGYIPTATSLQPVGRRTNSDSSDLRFNLKAGFTPNDTDEYTVNFTRNQGSKGGLLNVYNNPQSPANYFWRWPQWDSQSVSILTYAQIGEAYLKTKLFYNTFANVLKAYDDITYTTQSTNGRFTSPYSDDAFGVSAESGIDFENHALKGAFHFRTDGHDEYNDNRPTAAPNLHTIEPVQHQEQDAWSVALEDTYHVTSAINVVAGISFDDYTITASQDYNATLGLYSYPKGGANAFNAQGAFI